MKYALSTFGEGQIRLTVPQGERLSSCRTLRMSPAGSEANVAGILAQLGHATSWASVLPDGDLTTRILQEYASVGVDVSHVRRVPEGRTALYFLEPGVSPLPSRVTYDRENTPFRDLTPDQLDLPALLDTTILFVTGITAALSESTAATVAHAVHEAGARGTAVVLDVNHRSLLWEADRARRVLEPLMDHVTLLFCSRADAARVFGTEDGPASPARQLRERYGVEHVVSTDGARGVHYSGSEGSTTLEVEPMPVTDRPGAGDSFIAGTLHGFLQGSVTDGLSHGLQAARFALTHFDDLTRITVRDLEPSASGDIVR